MIMVSQDQDPSQGAVTAVVGTGKEGTGGWRGSSRSRRAMMPPIRGGRSAPRPQHPNPAARAPATTWPRPRRAASRPGRWQGGGLADLGFREGQVIDREVFERLYGKFLDPRDPTGRDAAGTGAAAVPLRQKKSSQRWLRWSRKPPPSAARS